MAGFALAGFDSFFDVGDEEVLVLVARDAREGRAFAVSELVGPCHQSEGGACEASVL